MKGVILAGGTGSRLMPMTKVTNKHLLPVYDRPMIMWPLQTLMRAGIQDIMIVSGKGHAGHFLELLGSGRDLGISLSYAVQEEAGGIAEALMHTEYFG
jgi:glucose-1-phosphate thymidylyltransferase